jgi:hypothetical protein
LVMSGVLVMVIKLLIDALGIMSHRM